MFSNVGFYVLAALSCWRLTSLLVNEDGPFHIFEFIRKLFIKPTELGKKRKLGLIGEILSCVWCASIWVGLAIAIVAAIFGNFEWYELVAMPFVLSALSIYIENNIT